MSFVNEYVSEENIQKYDLAGVRKKWRCDIPPGFRYVWTFDAERNCYFIPLYNGREELSNHSHCVLFYKGVHWDVEAIKESASREFDGHYRIVWGLIGIRPPVENGDLREELVAVLKEALTVFGHRGVYGQIENTVVHFTF